MHSAGAPRSYAGRLAACLALRANGQDPRRAHNNTTWEETPLAQPRSRRRAKQGILNTSAHASRKHSYTLPTHAHCPSSCIVMSAQIRCESGTRIDLDKNMDPQKGPGCAHASTCAVTPHSKLSNPACLHQDIQIFAIDKYRQPKCHPHKYVLNAHPNCALCLSSIYLCT